MKPKRLWLYAAVSLMAAVPVGGFIFGLVTGGDPDPNPIGRVVYACMMAVVTSFHAGFPPNHDAGAAHSFNVWPYITASFLLILAVLVLRDRQVSK